MGLKVAVTGPSGDIGRSVLRALDGCDAVEEVRGMARRPFDTAALGLSDKVVYRRGDVLDRGAIDELVGGADVVVHLAFLIIGRPEEAHKINLQGSRNVFEAAVAATAVRLVYTSSVAAYGFHDDNPQPLTEEVPTRGSDSFYYAAHKAELESVLDEVIDDAELDAYVFRPCIVAGPDALSLIETMLGALPLVGQFPLARRAVAELPFLAPILPDPGVPLQLVHHDDVAAAILAATLGDGEPGAYNLAAPGELSIRDLARAAGWLSVPIPTAVVGRLDDLLKRIPRLPPEVAWLTTVRVAMAMDATKAARELGWRPRFSAGETIEGTVEAARREGLI